MTGEQGNKSGEQALERRGLRAEKRKNKRRMAECEYSEVHDKKNHQKKSLVGLLPLDLSLCHCHFYDIVKTDDHIFGPVKNQDCRDTPAEKHHADKGNEVREDKRPDGYPEHRLYGSQIGVQGQEVAAVIEAGKACEQAMENVDCLDFSDIKEKEEFLTKKENVGWVYDEMTRKQKLRLI